MTKQVVLTRFKIGALALLATSLLGTSAHAVDDPDNCFGTGPALEVFVFRADGTTPAPGSVAECDTICYRVNLIAGTDNNKCAFQDGELSITTPDGIKHVLEADVPCLGGNGDNGSGCDPNVDSISRGPTCYTIRSQDIVGGIVTANATYAGGFALDNEPPTPGVGATTPKVTPVFLCDDANLCQTNVCTPSQTSVGVCTTPPVTCPDPDECRTATCNPETGACDPSAPRTCEDPDACRTATCNPVTGACDPSAPTDCNDNDPCTNDSCDPVTGDCVNEDNGTCEAICRTPGYWGTHGAVTLQVLNAAGGITVCGEVIDDVDVNSASSALEGICVSPAGDSKLQLARQLTAFALNCVVSGFGDNCSGALEDLWADCNAACVGAPSDLTVGDCISAVDCFNNGGDQDSEGICIIDDINNCHNQPLPDTLTLGPADSSQTCNQARKNTACTIIPPGESSCGAGTGIE